MAVMPYWLEALLPLLKLYKLNNGKLCTMSRQDIYPTRDQLEYYCKKYHYELRHLSFQQIEELNKLNPVRQTDIPIRNDQIFWRELGFDSASSIDAQSFEGATHIIDLNHHAIPDTLKNHFDLILDIGTMEHVFHVPNYLANLFDLVRTGGYIWQTLPMNNWVNHGFYQFSPTLLNDFYVQNHWKIIDRRIIQIDEHWANIVNQYAFDDEDNFVEPLQKLDNQFYYASIIVQKTKEATYNCIPQQYTYLKHQWTGQKSAAEIKNIVKIKTDLDIINQAPASVLMNALTPMRIKNFLKTMIKMMPRHLKILIPPSMKRMITKLIH
jgi:hypothetical protein